MRTCLKCKKLHVNKHSKFCNDCDSERYDKMQKKKTYSITDKYTRKLYPDWESILNHCDFPQDECVRVTITKGSKNFIVSYRYPKRVINEVV